MKVTAIGDIHGRRIWEDIIDESKSDHTVFVGDYFDSRDDIGAHEQIENFRNILNYAGSNAGKVSLLLGNHDFHYLPVTDQRYSQYQEFAAIDIREILQEAIRDSRMSFAKQIDNVLYTHAGVTNTWLQNTGHQDGNDVEDFINGNYHFFPQSFEIQKGSPFGDDIYQSPIWIRPASLEIDAIIGVKQVVGHTTGACIRFSHDENTAFIDTLGQSGEYLLVDDGEFKVQGKTSLSVSEYVEIMKLFDEKKEGHYMRFIEDFEFVGHANGTKPNHMLFFREGEVFGTIGDKELKMPMNGMIMEMYTKEEAQVMGYHFRIQ